ncbi:hypothetical protein [Bosea sp. (in: a-proteobacteria)]|uniref:hypothetical protein n=1 Tax=Bosea sp. (in: a-proteobacteria) TaxID=1871050 RepID=UPI0025B9B4F5|nr:hypothetical protein [Bosea sp. (in: a-proteobacteria)]
MEGAGPSQGIGQDTLTVAKHLPRDLARFVIRNEDELNASLDRAIYLAGVDKGDEEQRELEATNAAVKLYEQSLAVTTAASRSRQKTSDDVSSGTGSE